MRPCTRIVIALLLLGFCRSAASQDLPPRSIHQIEDEIHRALPWSVPPWTGGPRPLSESAPANLVRTVFGFYPYWAPGFSEIRFQDLTHLAVFSAEADGTGRITALRGWPNPALVDAAHRAGTRVVLVCTLFNATQLQVLLSSEDSRRNLIRNLIREVIAGGGDGINIDFEGVPASQKSNLVTFMRDLAADLRAAIPGAHLSIDSPAVDWSNAWDYPALADICDVLMIMCYDYHYAGSANAGPVSPLAPSSLWGRYSVRWSLEDYAAKVGPERVRKLVMGIPYYGRDWPTTGDSLNAKTTGTATSRYYSAAVEAAALHGRRWESQSSTPWYYYTAPMPRQTWYDDAASLSLKYDLVYQLGIQGIGIWALTYDQGKTDLWRLIEERFAPDPASVVRRYIPRWIADEELYTGLALANPSRSLRDIVTRRFLSGQPSAPERVVTLRPGEQYAGLITQPPLSNPAIQQGEGWMELAFPVEKSPSMFMTGDWKVSRTLAGGPPVAAVPRQVLTDPGNWRSPICLLNPTGEVARLHAKLYWNGSSESTVIRDLRAGELFSGTLEELFVWHVPASLLPGTYLLLESNQPLAGFVTLGGDSKDNAVVPAQDVEASVRDGAFAYAVTGGCYRSQVFLVNPTDEPQALECRFLSGNEPPRATLQLPPRTGFSSDLASLFGLPTAVCDAPSRRGAISVRVTRGTGILGSLRIFSEEYPVLASLPLEQAATTGYDFPHFVQAQGYWTGLSLTNPGASPCEVSVEAFNAAGAALGSRSFVIDPEKGVVGLLQEWIPQTRGLSRGRLEVRAKGPVFATEIFGADDLTFIATVPGR